jgi:hypothetical protein
MTIVFKPRQKQSIDGYIAVPIFEMAKKFGNQAALLVAGIEKSPSLNGRPFWQQLHVELVKINESCNEILGVLETNYHQAVEEESEEQDESSHRGGEQQAGEDP